MKRLLFLFALSAPAGTGAQAPVDSTLESAIGAQVFVPDEAEVKDESTSLQVEVTLEDPPSPELSSLEEEPEAAPSPPGTHFLAELYGGVTLYQGMGGAGHLVIGAGGKRSGGFFRFYLLGGLGYTSVAQTGNLAGAIDLREQRHSLDLLVGLRVYAPVYDGSIRLFVEVLTGSSRVWAGLERGGERWDGSDWSPLGVFGFGVQVRILRQLSVGLRFAYRVARDPLQEVRRELGLGRGRTLTMTGGATWHF